MNSELVSDISAIHNQPIEMVLAVTGGGASAIGQLLAVPGGSRTVLDAQVPYGMAALAEWLGAEPDQACSERTARAMAMAAYIRARKLGTSGIPAAGVAATASLATDRDKRGDHRIHVALQTVNTTCSYTLVLDKGQRSRIEEERLAAELVVYAAGEAAGVAPNFSMNLRETKG